MNIQYGGIVLELIRTINFERQPVLSDDGTSYLFTKFTLNAVGIVNSQADPLAAAPGQAVGISYRRVGGVNILDTEPRTNPVLTDVAIRHTLSSPRETLIISNSTDVLLTSPLAGHPCDAKGGPFPETFAIQQVLGDARLFIVHFQITTYVNECTANENKSYYLLSNRFSQFHDLDEDYGLTIITDGSAYFREDAIQRDEFNPDAFRAFLFSPVPVGFKRDSIQVSAADAGGRMNYRIVDVQKSDQFVAGAIYGDGTSTGATRILVNYKEALISDKDFATSLINTIKEYKDYKAEKKSKAIADVVTGGFGGKGAAMSGRRGRP